MSTDLLRQSVAARVGRWPTSVINDATESRGLIDSLKVGRPQPVIWQPHLRAYQPGYLPDTSGSDLQMGATIGDFSYHEGGPVVFNGRLFKDVGGLSRFTLVERFQKLPRLNANIRQNSFYQISHQYSVPATDLRIFTATRNCTVKSVKMTVTARGTGGACTVMLEKVPSGVAIGGGGTQKNLLSASLDLVGAAPNTVQNGALTATTADLDLVAGDSLALNWTGTATSATGVITVGLQETDCQESGTLANSDFELSGTNAANAGCTFHAGGGIQLTTAASANDQLIVIPHQDTSQSAWASASWNTAKRLTLETLIQTAASIANTVFWARLGLTNPTPFDLTTDADQLLVWYKSSTDGYLHWSTSIGGIDATGILTKPDGTYLTVAASTDYFIEFGVDDDLYPFVIVNGILYYVGATAMTSLLTLKPSVGVQTLTTAAKTIVLRHLGVSMDY